MLRLPTKPKVQRLHQAQEEASRLRQGIEKELHRLRNLFTSDELRDRAKTLLVDVLTDKRSLLVLGGAAVGILLIRQFFSSGKDEVYLDEDEDGAKLVLRHARKPFLAQLVETAIKTFLLHMARKLLTDYIHRVEERMDDKQARTEN